MVLVIAPLLNGASRVDGPWSVMREDQVPGDPVGADWRAEAGSMTVPPARAGEHEGNMADTLAATIHGHPVGGGPGHPADETKRDLLELIAGAGDAIFAGGI